MSRRANNLRITDWCFRIPFPQERYDCTKIAGMKAPKGKPVPVCTRVHVPIQLLEQIQAEDVQ